MKTFWLAISVAVLSGCAQSELTAYREDPLAQSNPALLECSAGRAPVCAAEGGRTRKAFSNCRCGSMPGVFD